MKKWPALLTMAGLLLTSPLVRSQQIVTEKEIPGSFCIHSQERTAVIWVDKNDEVLVQKAAALLQQDIEAVTGKKPPLVNTLPASATHVIIIGSVEKSSLVKKLVAARKFGAGELKNKWESYKIQTLLNPVKGIRQALVIAGSDRRGTAFGVFELSRQIGVSPWYWWADVPVKRKAQLFIRPAAAVTDAPKVKYRGIFINDEAPALSGWSKEKFGGFNHLFYEKVFELILRLKSNYLWPAMWGNAFYDDDSLSIRSADDFGIVIGTSHHEPLMRAHDEWRRYGNGKWNYDSNETRLKAFWRQGMERATNEKIVSIGMRGDGDEPMSNETATALLEKIVKDQRRIIAEVTGKPAPATPQLWALYKEVQDYYDKGMRVPDDVTLLLCDDNWGNIRKLPRLNEKPRKGGYGIYYHFDYVGGPRNYKWVNTNPLPRVWEQMHLAWQYKARNIWIVNVGDIKPMEFPISFFLDYAWNPERIGANDIQAYTERWCAAQFGPEHAREIADILSLYGKYNGRRKPELLDSNTYHLHNYGEAERVTKDYEELLERAEKIYTVLKPAYQDAYFQLVLHPVKACANLQQLYTAVARNHDAYHRQSPDANKYAEQARRFYRNDSLITLAYHQLNKGKWNHMMSQTHIAYTYWQQPPFNTMPAVYEVKENAVQQAMLPTDVKDSVATVPAGRKINGNVFFEQAGYVSIDAPHYTTAAHTNGIRWKVLPDHGRTGDALTPFPVTAADQVPGKNAPHVTYEFYTYSADTCVVHAFFSPTLNIHNREQGLQYAISIDDGIPQLTGINRESNEVNIWNDWVANNIIIKKSRHVITQPGKHLLHYWMVHPGVVLQKLVLDFGGMKPSYLGPPETRLK